MTRAIEQTGHDLPLRIQLWREHRALIGRWVSRLRREPFTLLGTLILPVAWLLLFGNLLAKMAAGSSIPGGDYLRFMTAGAVVMTIYDAAMNGGVELLFDRESGLLTRTFAAPVHRASIVTSRFIYVVGLASAQSLLTLLAAMAMGVHFAAGIAGIIGCLVFGAMLGAGISSLSVVLAFTVRNHGYFFTITGLIGLPLLFVSSALVPLDLMPGWLRVLAVFNPLTHAIEAVRTLTIQGWPLASLARQFGALAIFDIACVVLTALLLRRGFR